MLPSFSSLKNMVSSNLKVERLEQSSSGHGEQEAWAPHGHHSMPVWNSGVRRRKRNKLSEHTPLANCKIGCAMIRKMIKWQQGRTRAPHCPCSSPGARNLHTHTCLARCRFSVNPSWMKVLKVQPQWDHTSVTWILSLSVESNTEQLGHGWMPVGQCASRKENVGHTRAQESLVDFATTPLLLSVLRESLPGQEHLQKY